MFGHSHSVWKLVKGAFAATAAVVALGSAPGWALPCSNAPVSTYTAAGFTCTVDSLQFSNITVKPLASNGGSVTLGNIQPFAFGNENGLSMNYISVAPDAGATADVAWRYIVTAINGAQINDALLRFVGNTDGNGHAVASEVLSNGVTLSLNSPGVTTTLFEPVGSLSVAKDQSNFVGLPGGFATTSILTNAFSTTGSIRVPEPASLALLGSALTGFGILRRRRRKAA